MHVTADNGAHSSLAEVTAIATETGDTQSLRHEERILWQKL